MFEKKKDSLFDTTVKSKGSRKSTMDLSDNPFVRHGMKASASIKSGNNAQKLSTTGSSFVDDFSGASRYLNPRPWTEVSETMLKLWAKDPELAIKEAFYLRMITRIVQYPDGTKTKNPQRGQGLKHEGMFRMMWISIFHPDAFWNNIPLYIAAASWKDVIQMLSYDLQYNGWDDRQLDWGKFKTLILAGLENPNTSELLKKYLPAIKAKSKCKTIESQADTTIGKWIASFLFEPKGQTDHSQSYAKYRRLKSSGTAHKWQQLISQGKLLSIDFNTIHGRALSQLVSSKFLANHGLTNSYQKWIESKPVAKFTGWPHELIQEKTASISTVQKLTIDKQFLKLVETAKKGLSTQGLRPISVLDCSGSMSSPMYIGGGKVGKLRSIEVAFSSAIFFNEMYPDSVFYDYYLSFSNTCEMHKFSGTSFTDKYFTSSKYGYGGTNFMSVFNMLVNFKRANMHVDENTIPNFIVVFSDGEFNSVGSNITNVEKGRNALKAAGYSKEYCESFGIAFVDLPNTFYWRNPTPKFETFADAKNTFYFSGYDLSPLAFLFGVEGQKITDTVNIPKTAEELFLAAMDQELLNNIIIND